jgi:hypothetical protein
MLGDSEPEEDLFFKPSDYPDSKILKRGRDNRLVRKAYRDERRKGLAENQERQRQRRAKRAAEEMKQQLANMAAKKAVLVSMGLHPGQLAAVEQEMGDSSTGIVHLLTHVEEEKQKEQEEEEQEEEEPEADGVADDETGDEAEDDAVGNNDDVHQRSKERTTINQSLRKCEKKQSTPKVQFNLAVQNHRLLRLDNDGVLLSVADARNELTDNRTSDALAKIGVKRQRDHTMPSIGSVRESLRRLKKRKRTGLDIDSRELCMLYYKQSKGQITVHEAEQILEKSNNNVYTALASLI